MFSVLFEFSTTNMNYFHNRKTKFLMLRIFFMLQMTIYHYGKNNNDILLRKTKSMLQNNVIQCLFEKSHSYICKISDIHIEA